MVSSCSTHFDFMVTHISERAMDIYQILQIPASYAGFHTHEGALIPGNFNINKGAAKMWFS